MLLALSCIVLILVLSLSNSLLYRDVLESSVHIPIYLVSLEKDKTRRKDLAVRPEFYYAVDGSTLDFSKIDKGSRTKGEIGCYLSHIHMLKKTYYSLSSSSTVLIMEDDARLNTSSKTFVKTVQGITKGLPTDWEVLFLGHNYYEVSGESFMANGFKVTPVDKVFGTHGYMVNTKVLTLEKIDELLPIVEPFDVAISKIFKSYVVEPKLIELSVHGSTSNTQGIN